MASADANPEKIALAILGLSRAERWSYGRLAAAIRGVAGALQAAGYPPGSCVVLRLGNVVGFPIAYLGAVAADLVPVPISAQLTAAEVQTVLTQTTPALVVADPALPLPATDLPTVTPQDLAAWYGHAPADPVPGSPNRPGYIVYTSGTSGQPRGVVHAHRAVWARRMMWDDWYGLTAEDRLLHAGAFNWTYTLGTGLLDPWAAGATALIPAQGVRSDQLGLLLRRHDATLFAAAPGVYRQLLARAPDLHLPKLRHGLSAGEKLPDAVRAAWERATSTPIFEAFGMSECSTFISASPHRPAPEGTLGYAQTGRHIAVLDDAGEPVARGTLGTLAIHRTDPGLMLRYAGAPEETAARFAGDWFLTGDRVAMRADGAIEYHGRNDDMMNAGGFRVSPLEVEAALATFDGVAEVAAAEVTVKADTCVIAAFYVSSCELDGDALSQHMSERLARYKCPRLFIRVDALPKSANGKLLRRQLRETYEAAHGQT
ncbi:MAG: class I adenylate-forming enzyme family protein [Pseudomonadota bacterium]